MYVCVGLRETAVVSPAATDKHITNSCRHILVNQPLAFSPNCHWKISI